MNKISKICGIFAVGTMMLSTFFVTSCNSEDDFDFGPDSQYSLAERKMTRAGETFGKEEAFELVTFDSIISLGATLNSIEGGHKFSASFRVRISRGEGGKPTASLIDYDRANVGVCLNYTEDLGSNENPENFPNSVNSVSLSKNPQNPNIYYLYVSGQCSCGIGCSGKVEGVYFI